MRLPLRLSGLLLPVVIAGLSSGCMGRVEPGEGDPPPSGSSSGGSSGGGSSSGVSSGSSSGSGGSSSGVSSSSGGSASSSSSGGPGDPDCSRLAVPDLARVCPDGSSVGGQYVLSNHECVLEFPCPVNTPPPGGDCSQGAACMQGTGCGTALQGNSGCSTSCMCDGTGHFQCGTVCQGSTCSPGSFCTPGSTCSGDIPAGDPNCPLECKCDSSTDSYVCEMGCVDAGPPPVTDPCPNFPVPDVCEICPNGTTECAHAILVMGQCEVEICPGS